VGDLLVICNGRFISRVEYDPLCFLLIDISSSTIAVFSRVRISSISSKKLEMTLSSYWFKTIALNLRAFSDPSLNGNRNLDSELGVSPSAAKKIKSAT
jgi:hypothetical protein